MKSLKEILVTEEIANNFPIFEEKGKFKFKNEVENVKDYTLVGYIKIQNELKPLYNKGELPILSDNILDEVE